MTPADLRAEAEKVLDSLLRYDPISIPPADIDALVAFAQRERLKARIEELQELIDGRWVTKIDRRMIWLRAELAALGDKEVG